MITSPSVFWTRSMTHIGICFSTLASETEKRMRTLYLSYPEQSRLVLDSGFLVTDEKSEKLWKLWKNYGP